MAAIPAKVSDELLETYINFAISLQHDAILVYNLINSEGLI